jgi:glutamate synthase (NADPH) small chain
MSNGPPRHRPDGPDDLQRYLRPAMRWSEHAFAGRGAGRPSGGTFRPAAGPAQAPAGAEPQAFRELFISDGMNAVAWEFSSPSSAPSSPDLWDLLLRGDDMSTVLMRFVWNLPLGRSASSSARSTPHLSDRYPMFKGLSNNWPAEQASRPTSARRGARARLRAGQPGLPRLHEPRLHARDVDLFVWLEVLRDKQCEEKPCELGIFLAGVQASPRAAARSRSTSRRCSTSSATGKFRRGARADRVCNPLPDVTGRVCPQELQCQGVCAADQAADRHRPARVVPARAREAGQPRRRRRRFAGRPDPWEGRRASRRSPSSGPAPPA